MTLALHPVLKKVLIVLAKNGVYAVLTNSALMLQWHSIFNFDNWAGVWALTKLTISVVATREGVIFLPTILKWSQTNASADQVFKEAVMAAEQSAKESQKAADVTAAKVQDVKDAAADVKKEEGK